MNTQELTAEHVVQWRNLRHEGARLYPNGFLLSEAESRELPAASDAARLDRGGCFGVFDQGLLVGIAALNRHVWSRARHRVEIGPFYVQPSAQGSGAADALMRAIVDHARAKGIIQLELMVAAGNTRAIAFYERSGFARTGRIPNAVLLPDGPEDDHFMVLGISKPETG